MAITNLYPNLPGHLVEFKDGGLQFTTSNDITVGKSVLILGTAFDGPVNEPVKIDATTVSQLYGSDVDENGYPNGATLTKYAKQAFKNGFSDVRCMRVTGSQAYVEIPKTVETITEDIDATLTFDVTGNAEQINLQLSKTPVVSGSLTILTDAGSPVNPTSMSRYEGKFSIGAGAAPAGSTVHTSYDYQVIVAKEKSNIEVSTDGVAIDTVVLATDLFTDNEKLYITDDDTYVTPDQAATGTVVKDNYNTAGFVITKSEESTIVLEKDVDYKVNADGSIAFLSTAVNIVAGDTVNISYYAYTVSSYSESVQFNDAAQTVTLPKMPKAGSTVTVTMDGTVIANATVAGNVVTIPADGTVKMGRATIAYTYEESTEVKEAMTVRAIYGGSAYKTAAVAITEITQDGVVGRRFTFTKPEAKKYSNSDLPFYFDSFTCKTVGQLKQALANYALNNVFEIICDDEDMTTADFPLFSGTLSEDGDDGVVVTNNEMFEALSGKRYTQADVDAGECTAEMIGYLKEQGAYQILENYNVDFIFPAGVYADAKQTVNKHSSFQHELALLCAVLTYRTKMTHGFIDVKPNSNTTLRGIQEHVSKLLKYNNIHYMMDAEGNDIIDAEGNKMDIGWYTSLVVGPEPVMISDTLGTYYGSPALAYAALCGSLKPESAPTNKALPGVKGMKYKFSNKQMNELVGNKMVIFKIKNEGQATASSVPYVVDGCTSGAPNSDYGRIATVKVVTDVIDQIREVSDPFLGEPNTVEQRNALSALISKRLSYLLQQGEILYYEFEINATIQQVILGECSISLTLSVPQELRKITTVVALRATA